MVSEADAALIKKHVFPGFVRGSNWFPQGMCVRCSLDLRELDKEKGQQENGCEEGTKSVRLKLPDDYLCDIPVQTRSTATQTCTCRWCSLARLNGPAFKTWKLGLTKRNNEDIVFICKHCGKDVSVTVTKHVGNATDADRVKALRMSITKEIKAKVALALVNEKS